MAPRPRDLRKKQSPALRTWADLAAHLRGIAQTSEGRSELERLLKEEAKNDGRLSFMNRIHGALDKLRYALEREDIRKGAKQP